MVFPAVFSAKRTGIRASLDHNEATSNHDM